jgi:Arm domain-containing DNA-binding protein
VSFELTKFGLGKIVGKSVSVADTRDRVMAKNIQRLTALAVARMSAPGLYADGGGLYLRVGRGGAKSWAFRFMLNGRPREMAFGSFTKVSLADPSFWPPPIDPSCPRWSGGPNVAAPVGASFCPPEPPASCASQADR